MTMTTNPTVAERVADTLLAASTAAGMQGRLPDVADIGAAAVQHFTAGLVDRAVQAAAAAVIERPDLPGAELGQLIVQGFVAEFTADLIRLLGVSWVLTNMLTQALDCAPADVLRQLVEDYQGVSD